MRRLAAFLVVLLLGALIPLQGWAPVGAESLLSAKIVPADDVYVYERYPTSNQNSGKYGGSLVVGYYKGWEYTYLKFNATSIPSNAEIKTVKLCLYSYKQYGSPVIDAKPVQNDSWSEEVITWDNRPKIGDSVLDTKEITSNGYYCWDITDYAKEEIAADGVISLALVPEGKDTAKFNSKESSYGHHPYLEVNYTLPKNVEISGLKVLGRAYVGQNTPINVTVVNHDSSDYSGLRLVVEVDGSVLHNETFSINANSEDSFILNWIPEARGGHTVTAKLFDQDGKLLSTKSESVESLYGVAISSYGVPSVVLVEEPVFLNFTLENNYTTDKVVNFSITINGSVVYSNSSLTLPAGGVSLQVPWLAPRYGKYELRAELKYMKETVSSVESTIFAQYNVTPSETLEILPSEDAYSYYYKGSQFSWKDYHPYGDKRELAIGNSSLYSRERAYLKFTVPPIPQDAKLVSAVLKVYVPYIKDRSVPLNVGVYNTTTSWSEKSAPQEPPTPGTLLAEKELSKGWVSWNLTDFIADHSNSTVAFILKLIDESVNNYAWIYSRENPGDRPHLEITYRKPVKVESLDNFTVAVIGNATVEQSPGGLKISVNNTTFSVVVSTKNLFVDGKNFDPAKPSLLAYWKAALLGVKLEENDFIAQNTLERTVTVHRKNLVLKLAMGDPSMAVIVVPMMGQKVGGVKVIKGGNTHSLGTNVRDPLGYYYTLGNHLVIVLKRDPTQVVVTFETYEIINRPSAFDVFYPLALHYVLYLKHHEGLLLEEYSNFTNLTSQLEGYGVDLSSVPVKEISSEMEQYINLTRGLPLDIVNFSKYKFKLYVLFVQGRKAFLLHKSIEEKLRVWNPVLGATLRTAIKNAQEQKNETGTGAQNQTSGNQTQVVVPSANETKEVKVLIDYSHGQYYVKEGVKGLTDRIFKELGWKVAINRNLLTYDMLKDYTVVIILNPKSEFMPSEVEALREYVENGGGLLLAGDWYKYLNAKSLNGILKGTGVEFEATELMDSKANSGRPYYPYVGIYNRDIPITRYIPEGWRIYYSGCTIKVSGNALWIIKGFDTSYAIDADGNTVHERGSNPVIAAAVEVGKGRIIAYGSSRAFSDVYYGKYIKSNWPFIKGALLWLAHQE